MQGAGIVVLPGVYIGRVISEGRRVSGIGGVGLGGEVVSGGADVTEQGMLLVLCSAPLVPGIKIE